LSVRAIVERSIAVCQPLRHPLRKIRQIVNDALAALDGDFAKLYSCEGRPSIAPEKLLRASLLQAFFSVRSERQLMEQLDYNLMFRWFVGLGIDDAVWDATVFTKNRDRLLDAEVAAKFMAAVLAHREVEPLLSSDHFSVDRHAGGGVGLAQELPRQGTARTSRRLRAATANATFMAKSARTTRMRRRPTPTGGSHWAPTRTTTRGASSPNDGACA
jgi:hypothetical protein